MGAFEHCLDVTVGHEGDQLSREPEDSGNWTAGEIGKGALVGSRFGISAASYPGVDIPNLTRAAAAALYRRDYWDRVSGDCLPPPVALLTFDAAVNNGVPRAARWLQATAGTPQDGAIGPQTLAALARIEAQHGGAAACIEFMAQRTFFMGSLLTWRSFGLGWARRLSALPYEAMLIADGK